MPQGASVAGFRVAAQVLVKRPFRVTVSEANTTSVLRRHGCRYATETGQAMDGVTRYA